jgi:hypothetical protein
MLQSEKVSQQKSENEEKLNLVGSTPSFSTNTKIFWPGNI